MMSIILKSLLVLLLCCYTVTALETAITGLITTGLTSEVTDTTMIPEVDPTTVGTMIPEGYTSTGGTMIPEDYTSTIGTMIPEGDSSTVGTMIPEGYTSTMGTMIPEGDSSTEGTMIPEGYTSTMGTMIPEARATCPESDQIHCKNSDRCTRVRYICDGDNDCGDNSDEDSSLCAAWRNSDCERNNARCTRNGRSDCVTISHYCELNDPPCEGSLDRRLCKMLSDEKIQDIDNIVLEETTTGLAFIEPTVPSVHYVAVDLTNEFKQKLDSTIRHTDCPQLYTKIGDQCVSVFFIGNLSWMESRAFCQAIGGDLFTIKPDLSNFLTLLQHLNANQMTQDFWIGGMYKNESLGWQWVDETDIQVGSPIWAVRHAASCSTREVTSLISNVTREANDGHCYHYEQAPSTIPNGHCSAITYEHFYYVSDEDCLTKKSPLCVMPDEHPKQAL